MAELHVVFGTGPAGAATAKALERMGKQVRSVIFIGVRYEF